VRHRRAGTAHRLRRGLRRDRIAGPVRENNTAVILAAVPAVADPAGWFLDVMPGRSADQGELIWSNLLDQTTLNDLLQADPGEL
jgi:hypothetical protein